MKLDHTTNLQKVLQGFELFILPEYDKYMEQERMDYNDYGTPISYQDNLADFYAWLDMFSTNWKEFVNYVEQYRDQGQYQEAMNTFAMYENK